MTHRLGRIEHPDPKDKNYLMRSLLAVVPTKTERFYRTGPTLNQGETGTCVGHGWRQHLSSAVLMTKTGPDAFTIYDEACLLDPWPDNDHGDRQFGTSVRAGVEALRKRGHIANYVWANDAATVRDWLLLDKGVVVVGTYWLEGMDKPDKFGFIHATGGVRGGHCYTIVGYSTKRNAFRLLNSWGLAWGENGRAWIGFDDLDWLIKNHGEACTAVEQPVPSLGVV